jgi:hypothetical protein
MAYKVSQMAYFWGSLQSLAGAELNFAENEEQLLESAHAYEFRYNSIHDFESLWWMFVWFLTYISPTGGPRTKDQKLWHHQLFVLSMKRIDLLTSDSTFRYFTNALPENFRRAMAAPLAFRSELVGAYRIAEASSKSFDCSSAGEHQLPLKVVNILGGIHQQSPASQFYRHALKRKKTANMKTEPQPDPGTDSKERSRGDRW